MEYTVTRQEMRMFDCMMIYHIFQIVWFLCRLELHYTVKENFIKNIQKYGTLIRLLQLVISTHTKNSKY